jgi:acetyl esterase
VMVRGMLHAFLNLPGDLEPVDRCLDLMAEIVRAP